MSRRQPSVQALELAAAAQGEPPNVLLEPLAQLVQTLLALGNGESELRKPPAKAPKGRGLN